jgi:hypothetical protein
MNAANVGEETMVAIMIWPSDVTYIAIEKSNRSPLHARPDAYID